MHPNECKLGLPVIFTGNVPCSEASRGIIINIENLTSENSVRVAYSDNLICETDIYKLRIHKRLTE